MKKPIVVFVMLKTIALLLTGCGQSPENALKKAYGPQPYKDVSLLPHYNFSTFAGTVWKTKVKLALADVKRYTGAYDPVLLHPIHFDTTNPKYVSGPEKHIIADLPIGSRLKIGRLMQDQGVWGGVQVEAILENGTNSGKIVYLDEMLLEKNRFVWAGWSSSTNWGVNPDILELVNSTHQP